MKTKTSSCEALTPRARPRPRAKHPAHWPPLEE